MRFWEWLRACSKYAIETFPGSFIDNVVARQPEIESGELNADLHTHPYIHDEKTLYDTLDVLVNNNVDICAITTHGNEDPREFDLYQVKALIENGLAAKLEYDDSGLMFQVSHKGKRLTFVGAYEMYVDLYGVNGQIDIISLMPDKGFEEVMRPGLDFSDYLKMNKDYGAIVIGAHPYTVWDPYGPFDLFSFKLADENERPSIRETFFPLVDTVDMVSTNCAWMIRSNELVCEDYPEKPLSNSDAHAKNSYCRKEIGRAGNLFKSIPFNTGFELREVLRSRIKHNRFRTYLNYTPSLQFLLSIAFGEKAMNFP